MASPNNDQYIRGMALEAAVQATQVLPNPNADYGVWTKESILALADEFAEYIEGRRKF